MRKLGILALVSLWVAAAQAQLQVRPGGSPPPPAPTAKAKPALQGAQRIQFILKQLDLNAEQQKHADALIETYYSGATQGQTLDIDLVKSLADQMQKAQAAGDTATVEKLSQQLKELGQGSQDEPEFLENMRKVLTDAQKAELTSVLERLKSNPSGSLRAIDVVRLARGAQLNEKQTTDLDSVIVAHRAKVNDPALARDATPPEARTAKQLDELIAAVRAILTPEQATKFETRIANMRPGSAAPKPLTP
jgi:hypothetical protein